MDSGINSFFPAGDRWVSFFVAWQTRLPRRRRGSLHAPRGNPCIPALPSAPNVDPHLQILQVDTGILLLVFPNQIS